MNFNSINRVEFGAKYRNFAPLSLSREGAPIFDLLNTAAAFERMVIATEELDLPAVAGIARACGPHIEAAAPERQDYLKKYVGAVVCCVLEANGFAKAGRKRAVPPCPTRLFRTAETYVRKEGGRSAQWSESFVLDQNSLQSEALQRLISSRAGVRFVLPDASFKEMSKHENFEYTFERALEPLSQAGASVFHAVAVDECVAEELRRLEPVTAVGLLDVEFTQFSRQLLEEIHQKQVGPARAALNQRFERIRRELLEEELNAERAKQRAQELSGPFLRGVKPPVLKALRNGKLGDDFRLAFIKLNSDLMMEGMLARLGHAEEASAAFLAERPMFLRWFNLTVRHSLMWAIRGNPQQVAAPRELNNQIDLEYALVASYFDALLTHDALAREAHADLMHLLRLSSDDATSVVRDGLRQLGLL